ncbi:MAG: hypothetical protein K1564_09155 [Candidatus Thiodiazotropha sp. (ex. Lucinisca nassula)]|nr:hypothetical protein [Candidatus Thiodiazotropha sp. (ex. Lucinisca nassula)]
MNKMGYHKMIDEFEQHYQYDSTYMRELLDSSPEGFTRFNNFMPLNDFREKLSLEDYWVAKRITRTPTLKMANMKTGPLK